MGYDAKGRVYIPLEEFLRFIKGYLPAMKDYVNFDLKNIRVEDTDMMIEYAASTECHPADWCDPPEWLKKGK